MRPEHNLKVSPQATILSLNGRLIDPVPANALVRFKAEAARMTTRQRAALYQALMRQQAGYGTEHRCYKQCEHKKTIVIAHVEAWDQQAFCNLVRLPVREVFG